MGELIEMMPFVLVQGMAKLSPLEQHALEHHIVDSVTARVDKATTSSRLWIAALTASWFVTAGMLVTALVT